MWSAYSGAYSSSSQVEEGRRYCGGEEEGEGGGGEEGGRGGGANRNNGEQECWMDPGARSVNNEIGDLPGAKGTHARGEHHGRAQS